MPDKDPCVVARELIEDEELSKQLHRLVYDVTAGQEEAREACRNLDRVGSGNIEAPTILSEHAGGPLRSFRDFLDRCVQDVEELS